MYAVLTWKQCDQMAILFLSIWLFPSMKTCPIAKHFAKVRLKFCRILNKPSKICPRLLKLCKSGEILPNLVTLVCRKVPVSQSVSQSGHASRTIYNGALEQSRVTLRKILKHKILFHSRRRHSVNR